MSRPKGSKNKKTLQEEAMLGSRIEEQKTLLARLQKEEAQLQSVLSDYEAKMKVKRKEVRTVSRLLVKLTKRKQELDSADVERAQKAEIEKVVTTLMGSGTRPDEIIELLKKK